MSQTAALRDELGQLRSHAARQAGGLSARLENLPSGSDPDWPALAEAASGEPFAHRLYAAVVDEAGEIVWHSDPQRVGQRLGMGWYDRRVPEAGPDVAWTEGGVLSGDLPAYDLSAPLYRANQVIGEYHEGLDGRWAAGAFASRQRAIAVRWLGLLSVAVGIVAVAVFALWRLRRGQELTDLKLSRERRSRQRELSQLGGGLSHEVRNPLHVLRINLHTLRRALGGKGLLQESHIRDTLVESDAAISRLDALMRDLLQFTDPAAASEPTELNVCREIQLIAELLQADLTRRQIELCTALPANPALVAIDPVRLRQMLLNVLTFAQHRSGQPGRIAVEVAVADGNVQILVTDSGQPLQPEQAAHVFEPFQAPVETGSGLGLALVQTYAEASGGRVALEQPGPTGNRLRISLPLAATHPGELIA